MSPFTASSALFLPLGRAIALRNIRLADGGAPISDAIEPCGSRQRKAPGTSCPWPRSKVLTIEAEDALIAALKAKQANPEATITYVRKSNRRGDRRHPHEGLSDRN